VEIAEFPYRRIVVIGPIAAGKSTFAQRLARRLGNEYVELDALYWEPHWVPAPPERFRAAVAQIADRPAWVVAGNFANDIIWPRADLIVWLDYSLAVVLWRLLIRTLRRCWRCELLWGTNYERLSTQLKVWSRESNFHRAVVAHWPTRRENLRQMIAFTHTNPKVLRFRRPRETEAWFESL
jgi:adenylate kinase family enzyme